MAAENAVIRDRVRRVLVQRLEDLGRAGVRQLPEPSGRPAPEIGPAVPARAAADAVSQTTQRPMEVTDVSTKARASGWSAAGIGAMFDDLGDGPREASAAPSLEVLQQEVAGCTRCGELAATRTQTVFGVGDPQARLCFMGEAPGGDEDRLGEPFVGRAGQLLNKIIEACRLRREDVYILNMLKCRPPGNRNPAEPELANCRPFLDRQLELIQPEFICCLGAVAAQNLLGSKASIGKLRGSVHTYRGAKVVCTYHPAYLLRNPAAKKDTWDDMKLLMCEMGVEL